MFFWIRLQVWFACLMFFIVLIAIFKSIFEYFLGQLVDLSAPYLPAKLQANWARTFSALSVHDFVKRTSVVEVMPGAYAELARHAGVIARYEGFDAHANAVGDLRKKLLGN